MTFVQRYLLLTSGLLVPVALAHAGEPASEPGDFNAATFGTVSLAYADGAGVNVTPLADSGAVGAAPVAAGTSIQVEWRQPRDVHAVRLVFAGAALSADQVELAWWHHVWPDNGEGGWMKVDDPYNGRFVVAAVNAKPAGPDSLLLRLKPLEKTENAKIEAVGFAYRRTYKVRVTFRAAAKVRQIECLTDSHWKTAEIKVERLGHTSPARFDAVNARIISTERPSESVATLKLQYADNPRRLSPDRGHVIVRQDGQGQDFSFFVDDVLREGIIFVRDINAYISDATRNLSPASWRKPADAWDATVIEKVAAMPEQTRERATTEIPPKWIPVAHLGLPILRQEISINERSMVYTEYLSLRSPGPDRARSPNLTRDEAQRHYTLVTRREQPFGPAGPKVIKRWLEDGYLPIIHSQWQLEDVDYHQTVLVTALDSEVLNESLALPVAPLKHVGTSPHAADFGSGLRGDEPVAGLARLEMENRTQTDQVAGFWLKVERRPPMRIEPNGLLRLESPTTAPAGPDLIPLWGQIDIRGRGDLSYKRNFFPVDSKEPRDVIRYDVKLAPGEKHAIVLKVPYIEQFTVAEVAQLTALDWESTHAEVKRLWNLRLAAAIDNYQVPDQALMNLYRANLWHVLITTDRDPSTGLYQHGAGTYDYPNYPNEAMMVARSLEMRGEHEEARRIIEPCLISQGTRSLPGNFKSKEGLLYAAAPPGFDHYTAQGYNMHHGFILWAAAEHYLWTGDRQYLDAVTPNLISACEWITRERQATMKLDPDGRRPLEWGLAPAGDLEDVAEYLYWYATNAYYHLGMKTTARVLAQINHPEAARIAEDAREYAADIMASVRESTARSPVVRLFDGSYVPYIPSRAYALTDRSEGWIREGLYCSLHLLDGDLVRPDDPLVTWILNVLEDRIFMSAESGHGPKDRLTDPKAQFFSWGGFNNQPNLLDNSIAYLKRGQIPHFLRAFWNTYAMSLYPDIQCFAESVSFGMGGGPLYKTPDESKFIQWMHQMLVYEMDGDLYIGRGVPRAWMADGQSVILKNAATYFGPIDLKITSAAAQGEITADINLPGRDPAKAAHVSLRHPDGRKMKSAKVNNQPWTQYDPATDTVTVPGSSGKVVIVAGY